ncbi:type II toxin-antitoxin system Phd/YefM family antitoxin [Sabulicella rubraurantiaca]|uniref:type II toxin-antitoxin system Phd/YefM family antitoxin n=1 Tax=Sabulicella rubraurantiaca TaxID=2811429 RepID=UPI001A97A9BF|nr:type II toxin-antitoxin system Phd/YefM family antitoxin [Sabulicella rubraurantiaca]
MIDGPIPLDGGQAPGLEGLPRAEMTLMEQTLPQLVDAALRGPLVLTRNGQDAFVILPVDAYGRLAEAAARKGPVIEG